MTSVHTTEPPRPQPPSAADADADADARAGRRSRAMLVVLCGAIFLEGLDVSMLGVALPSIRADLGMSTSSLQWVVSAYVLGYGGFMLLGGRAADLLGRRRMFLLWLGVFVAFSGLGGIATEGWVLIAARFATGVAAAFLTPAGLSIITTNYAEGPARNRALLVYAATASAGFSLGLVVGGLLTELSWRWVFFAPVLLASAILAVAARVVPDDGRPPRTAHRFDVPGVAGLTGGMLLLIFTVVQAPDVAAAQTVATTAGSLLLLGAFVAVERRSVAPLVRLGILRSGRLVRANLAALAFAGSFFGFQFMVVLYLQELRGWSSLESGLALLAVSIDAVLAPTVTPRLVRRFGTVRVILAGLSLAAVSYALFLPVGADWTYLAMLPTMLILGVAFALAYGPLTIAATEGIAPDEQGLAGGLLNTSFQFGAALGLALVTAVNVAATDAGGSAQAQLDGYRAALVVPLVAAGLAAGVTALGLRRRVGPAGDARPGAGSAEPATIVTLAAPAGSDERTAPAQVSGP